MNTCGSAYPRPKLDDFFPFLLSNNINRLLHILPLFISIVFIWLFIWLCICLFIYLFIFIYLFQFFISICSLFRLFIYLFIPNCMIINIPIITRTCTRTEISIHSSIAFDQKINRNKHNSKINARTHQPLGRMIETHAHNSFGSILLEEINFFYFSQIIVNDFILNKLILFNC